MRSINIIIAAFAALAVAAPAADRIPVAASKDALPIEVKRNVAFGGCGACAQLDDGEYKPCWSSYQGWYSYYLQHC